MKTTCTCVIVNREEGESQRLWFMRWMCTHHWSQTDYYVPTVKVDPVKLRERKQAEEYPPLIVKQPEGAAPLRLARRTDDRNDR